MCAGNEDEKTVREAIAKPLAQLNAIKRRNTWYVQSDQTLSAVNLQKSQWSRAYYLNIAIFLQADFPRSKLPPEYRAEVRFRLDQLAAENHRLPDALNLENQMNNEERAQIITGLVQDIAVPIIRSSATIEGVRGLYNAGVLQRAFITGVGRQILQSQTHAPE
jgi:hypothetical protein